LCLKVPAFHMGWSGLTVAPFVIVLFASLLYTPVAIVIAAALGFVLYTAIAAVTALTPPLYPAHLRATGYGSMSGIGRAGAIIAPIVAGYLVTVISPTTMYIAASVPLLIAAAII